MRTGTAVSLKPTGQTTVSASPLPCWHKAFLRLQARGAGAAFLGEQRAKSVFIALAVVRQLPGFDRLQRDRQAGQIAERAFVVAVDAGVGQGVHQGAVALAVFRRRGGVETVGLRLVSPGGHCRNRFSNYCSHESNLRQLVAKIQLVQCLILLYG